MTIFGIRRMPIFGIFRMPIFGIRRMPIFGIRRMPIFGIRWNASHVLFIIWTDVHHSRWCLSKRRKNLFRPMDKLYRQKWIARKYPCPLVMHFILFFGWTFIIRWCSSQDQKTRKHCAKKNYRQKRIWELVLVRCLSSTWMNTCEKWPKFNNRVHIQSKTHRTRADYII